MLIVEEKHVRRSAAFNPPVTAVEMVSHNNCINWKVWEIEEKKEGHISGDVIRPSPEAEEEEEEEEEKEEEEEEEEEEISRETSEDRITNDWRPVYGFLHKQHLRWQSCGILCHSLRDSVRDSSRSNSISGRRIKTRRLNYRDGPNQLQIDSAVAIPPPFINQIDNSNCSAIVTFDGSTSWLKHTGLRNLNRLNWIEYIHNMTCLNCSQLQLKSSSD